MKLKFIDKNKEQNLKNGIEFYATGLIVSSHLTEGGDGNASGKDFAVEFIDPFGIYCNEWRSKDEIIISEIEDEDYKYLKICFQDDGGS